MADDVERLKEAVLDLFEKEDHRIRAEALHQSVWRAIAYNAEHRRMGFKEEEHPGDGVRCFCRGCASNTSRPLRSAKIADWYIVHRALMLATVVDEPRNGRQFRVPVLGIGLSAALFAPLIGDIISHFRGEFVSWALSNISWGSVLNWFLKLGGSVWRRVCQSGAVMAAVIRWVGARRG